MPPSVPACRIQGTLDVGSDIMLICSSEEGIPTPSYSWEKLDALPKLPHNAMQGITNKLAVGVPFCPTFAGKSHTHSVVQTPSPVMCQAWTTAHPKVPLLWSCWGVIMDGWSDSNRVSLWISVSAYKQSDGFVVFYVFLLLSCWMLTLSVWTYYLVFFGTRGFHTALTLVK